MTLSLIARYRHLTLCRCHGHGWSNNLRVSEMLRLPAESAEAWCSAIRPIGMLRDDPRIGGIVAPDWEGDDLTWVTGTGNTSWRVHPNGTVHFRRAADADTNACPMGGCPSEHRRAPDGCDCRTLHAWILPDGSLYREGDWESNPLATARLPSSIAVPMDRLRLDRVRSLVSRLTGRDATNAEQDMLRAEIARLWPRRRGQVPRRTLGDATAEEVRANLAKDGAR